MKKKFYLPACTVLSFMLLSSGCTPVPTEEKQGNEVKIENGSGNTVIQVNIKIENIETNAPITNGSIVLAIDGKEFKEKLNAEGIASLPVDKSFENRKATLTVKDSKGNEQYTQGYVIQETPQEPNKIAIQPFKRFVINEINGHIAQGAENEHTFPAKPNVPLLVQVKNSDALSFTVKILNASAEVLSDHNYIHSPDAFYNIPFTAPAEGNYTVKIIGYRNEGNYKIHIVYLDGEGDLSNNQLVLNNEQQHYDKVGLGSYDSYFVTGLANNTIVVQTKCQDHLSYQVKIYNSIGEKVEESSILGPSEQYYNMPFTPQDSGRYEIRVLGYGGFGPYDVRYYVLSKPVYEAIEFGTIKSSKVGQNGYHEYQFKGIRNKSLRIKTMCSQGLSYFVQVFNASGEQVSNNSSIYGNTERYNDELFTPQKDGDYVVRIVGYRHFGEYKLLLEDAGNSN